MKRLNDWGDYVPRDYDELHLATCPNCKMDFELTLERQKWVMIAKEEKKD